MKKVIGLIISGLLVLSMGTIALADTTTDSLTRSTHFSGMNNKGQHRNGNGRNQKNYSFNRIGVDILAELTDKTPDELTNLLSDDVKLHDIAEDEGVLNEFLKQTEEKRYEMLKENSDARLSDGQITQEDYDAALDKYKNSKILRGVYRDLKFDRKSNFLSTLAGMTDKSEDEIAKLYEDKGAFYKFIKDEEIYTEFCTKVHETVVSNKKEYLDNQLKNGKITQEQYDLAIEQLTEKATFNHNFLLNKKIRGMGNMNGTGKGRINNSDGSVKGNLLFK